MTNQATHVINGREFLFVEVEKNTLNHTLSFHRGKTRGRDYGYFHLGYEYDKYSSYTHGGFTLFYKVFGGKKYYPEEGKLKLIGTSESMSEEEYEGLIERQIEIISWGKYDDLPKTKRVPLKESALYLYESLGLDTINKTIVVLEKEK